MAHWRRTVLRWVLLAVLAVLVGVPVGLWLWLNARYGRELAAELDKLRAAGAPLTAAAAMPSPVPANQNAAPLYLKVFHLAADGRTPAWQNTPDGLRQVEDSDTEDSESPDHAAYVRSRRAALSSPAARQALNELRAASRRPYCVFRDPPAVRDHYPEYNSRFRSAARVVAARATLSALDGDIPAACDWLAVGYRMADHVSQAPSVLGQLVCWAVFAIADRAAQDSLADATLDAASVAELTRALERCRLGEYFSRAQVMERAQIVGMFDDIRRDPYYYGQTLGGIQAKLGLHTVWFRLGLAPQDEWGPLDRLDPVPVVGVLLTGAVRSGVAEPTLRLEEINLLRYRNREVEQSRVPYRRLVSRWREPTTVFRPGTMMLGYASRVFVPCAAKRDTYQARVDLLRTVLMLKVYRHERGSYPAGLAALGPKRPTDVFSGKDFIYRRQGQGFVLYSVGQNLQDDGGHEVRRDPTQGDIVWECGK